MRWKMSRQGSPGWKIIHNVYAIWSFRGEDRDLQVSQKFWLKYARLCGVTSQSTALFLFSNFFPRNRFMLYPPYILRKVYVVPSLKYKCEFWFLVIVSWHPCIIRIFPHSYTEEKFREMNE
jgi:hypothetical protein